MGAILHLVFAAVALTSDLSPVFMARPTRESDLTIVSNGCARIPIVTADDPSARRAAIYLAATIRDITGVRPAIIVEYSSRSVTNAPALRVTKPNATDAFRVITKGGSVYFLGQSDFAVYDWCERALGVRYYCEWGKTYPRTRELTVPSMDYADKAVFAHRDMWPFNRQEWARTSKAGGLHRGGVCVHAPHRWFRDPDIRTNHPGVFARQPDGSRGEMPLLCYGNPETLAYYKRRIDEHIAGVRDSGGIVDTNRHIITVSHWDVRLECTCEHCRRLFDPTLGVTGSGSPVIWGYFLRDLAQWSRQTHPDYTVAFLPYLNVCDVPKGMMLSRLGNCEAMVCSMPGLALFKEPSIRDHEEALIAEWACVTGRKVINWHYSCWPREYTSAPYLYGKTIAEHYKRMEPFTVGSFVCGGDATANEKLMNYVWLKCLWNPNIDVDALYDIFAERFFGPAAAPMRRLMAMQEDGWARHWEGECHCHFDNIFGVAYPHDDIVEMKRLLCDAADLAQDDPVSLACVRWYANDFTRFFAEEEWYRKGVRFPVLTIRPTASPPTIDGDLDDSAWQASQERSFVAAFGNKPLSRPTRVRTLHTDSGLYLSFRCFEPNMNGLVRTAAYGEISGQDTLEIFLDASGSGKGTCHRLMFDVRNRMSVTASTCEWTADGVVSAVACDDDQWRLEVYVPFASLSGNVSKERWHGNFVRWHPGKPDERERSRLSTLESEWNQDRNAFTQFIFE